MVQAGFYCPVMKHTVRYKKMSFRAFFCIKAERCAKIQSRSTTKGGVKNGEKILYSY